MELWVFDRSGAYSSGEFDIHAEPDKFARALVGYATMDADSMGLDTFIERQGGHRFVTIKDGEGEKKMRLEKILVRQAAIVCRGTTCYRTRQGHVLKLAWASDKRVAEIEHLRLAEEKGVEGVAKAVAYQQITSVVELRADLTFGKRHKFHGLASSSRDIHSVADVSIGKGKKRKSVSEAANPAKRSRSNSQESALGDRVSSGSSPSLYASSQDEPYENRIYSCLAVSPAGRVISSFQTVSELVEGLRDAIRAHQSLLTKGSMLHRDIPDNNIIITRPEDAAGFKGMLIDLDLAKKLNSKPSGARHQTGTMQFMAIEVLRRADHTYRHDLESFFYMLLWMCARRSWSNGFAGEGETQPRESVLRGWERGSFKDIAKAKMGDMTVNGLEQIFEEFPQALDPIKPLCLKIRSILFGDTARLVVGTPKGAPSELYDGILAAYDECIRAVFNG